MQSSKPSALLRQNLLSTVLFWTTLGFALLVPALGFADEGSKSLGEKIDGFFGTIVGEIATIMFWPVPGIGMPVVVLWLLAGALFLTVRMGFINVRLFKHAIDVVRGKYDNPDDEGEVTHFQALASALSATVGLGNIAGVAIAVGVGGPGATFWMIVVGLFGMTAKFTECSLGQMYRKVKEDGTVSGGPMHYLSEGLAEMKFKKLGTVLAVMFAVLCVGGSLGGGNAFQVNQSLNVVAGKFEFFATHRWSYGLMMSLLVGAVIIGGMKRIAQVAEKIVPSMCGLYVLICLIILGANAGEIPGAIGTIISQAFNPDAAYGGFIGVLVMGVKRAAFSNEAGIGSAAIAHSAAKTAYPVREGIVSLLEPMIDTVIVCTMTALVIVITGAYNNPANAELIATDQGAALTAQAMGSVSSVFPWILLIAVVLFAYSTMISWSYYGERCFTFLFGVKHSMTYRVIFVVMVFLGSILTSTNVLVLSDLMILSMAFPNILGLYFLNGKVKAQLDEYMEKLKKDEFKVYK